MTIDPSLPSVLLHPERWMLRATGLSFPPEPPVSVSRRRWCARHSHPHSHAEMMIALAGRTVYHLQGRFVAVCPATVILFRPMEPHQCSYPPEEADVDHLWFHLMRDHFAARRVRVHSGRISSVPLGDGIISWSCPEWLFRMAEKEPPEWIAFRLRLLAMHLVQSVLESRGQSNRVRSQEESVRAIIRSIQRHLEQTAGCGDSLASLARIAGYSPYHFHRLFRRYAGCRVHDFLNRCRLQRVRQRQAEGWTCKAIAQELGFASPQSFARWQRRYRDRL